MYICRTTQNAFGKLCAKNDVFFVGRFSLQKLRSIYYFLFIILTMTESAFFSEKTIPPSADEVERR